MSHHLSDIIPEYLAARKAAGYKAYTLRNDRASLDHLLTTIGNLQIKSIHSGHIDVFFGAMQAKGHVAGTMNIHMAVLRSFFAWCRTRRLIPSMADPMAGRRWYKAVPRAKLRIPADQFPHLLDSAEHPRDRILVALGLFLFLRASEINLLRVADVDLSSGEIRVQIPKTSQSDIMPICYELDQELRRWLRFMASELGGPVQPDHYLVCAKNQAPWVPGPGQGNLLPPTGKTFTLIPDRPVGKPAMVVNRVMELAGHRVRGDDGESLHEGCHTLRRSGARARFDHLVSEGYDGALREVQAMLHHASGQMTERYLGLDLDITKRNVALRGKPMFSSTTPAANVVSIQGMTG